MSLVEIFGLLLLGMILFLPFTILFNSRIKNTVLKEKDKKTPKE